MDYNPPIDPWATWDLASNSVDHGQRATMGEHHARNRVYHNANALRIQRHVRGRRGRAAARELRRRYGASSGLTPLIAATVAANRRRSGSRHDELRRRRR